MLIDLFDSEQEMVPELNKKAFQYDAHRLLIDRGCCPGGWHCPGGGWCCPGGGAVQGGVVLSITGSDIINPPCEQND